MLLLISAALLVVPILAVIVAVIENELARRN